MLIQTVCLNMLLNALVLAGLWMWEAPARVQDAAWLTYFMVGMPIICAIGDAVIRWLHRKTTMVPGSFLGTVLR